MTSLSWIFALILESKPNVNPVVEHGSHSRFQLMGYIPCEFNSCSRAWSGGVVACKEAC